MKLQPGHLLLFFVLSSMFLRYKFDPRLFFYEFVTKMIRSWMQENSIVNYVLQD